MVAEIKPGANKQFMRDKWCLAEQLSFVSFRFGLEHFCSRESVCAKNRAHVTLLERLKRLENYRSVTSFSVS